jgi:hypothetical protein
VVVVGGSRWYTAISHTLSAVLLVVMAEAPLALSDTHAHTHTLVVVGGSW